MRTGLRALIKKTEIETGKMSALQSENTLQRCLAKYKNVQEKNRQSEKKGN